MTPPGALARLARCPPVWLIPALPLAGALLNIAFGRFIGQRAHWIAVPAVAGSFLASCAVFARVRSGGASTRRSSLDRRGDFETAVKAYVDPLTGVMLLVVTGVGFLIHLYSIGYMHDDPGYARYFAYLNLFVFSMTMLVLAGNFLLLFVVWEAVGLCSYLLIGFWYTRTAAATPARRRSSSTASATSASGWASCGCGLALGTLDFARASSARRRRCRRRPPPGSRCCSSWAPAASRPSSRSTSGCPTRWRAPRRSPR